ncbi:Ger(x)C family spore germination protein [Paenibacillus pasadenensis]|uniref:Ger(x)C family spore germination protein n=1 Tax=Paenibacillus pasadenensis TaxID=217090 RepID=UPI000413781C|nr:Ger(x)C family spore germination protein [Paenibacillus pasadenensis]
MKPINPTASPASERRREQAQGRKEQGRAKALARLRTAWSGTAALLLLLAAGGCWDSKDVDNRFLVGAMGLDAKSPERLEVWFRVPVTSPMGGGHKSSFFAVSQEGSTVMDAVNRVQYKLPKAIDVSSTRALFLDEQSAQYGLLPYLEFAVRERTVPLDAVVAVVEGGMKRIFESPNPAGELAGIYTKLYFEPYAGGIPRKNKTMLWEVYAKLHNPMHANLIPVLRQEKKDFIQTGNAFFRSDHMAGRLTMDESLLYEMMTKRLTDSEIVLMSRSDLNIVHNKTRVRSRLAGGKPRVEAEISLSVSLLDKSHSKRRSEDEIKEELAEQLDQLSKGLIAKTQKAGSDIFGFGNRFRDRIKPDQWPDLYRQGDIRCTFKIEMRNTGLEFLRA